MNLLLIDDIKLVGNSIKDELTKNTIWGNIYYYYYDIEKTFLENRKEINKLIYSNKIDILCLDRGYSKIYEEEVDEFVYSSITKLDRNNKIKAEDVLLGDANKKGLLDFLSDTTTLKTILLYTYDKGNYEIDIILEELKEKINLKLTSLSLKIDFYCFETSSIFNKPLNTEFYPNSFYISPSYQNRFIDFQNKRRNIGTKKAYIEYGQLIANIINDLVCNSKKNIYSFFHDSSIKFDSFLRIINNLSIADREEKREYFLDNSGNSESEIVQYSYHYSKMDLSALSTLFKINDQEKYIVDIPFKEYYSELNQYINDSDLLNLFKDDKGNYLKSQHVVYDYNYKDDEKFLLYDLRSSCELKSKKVIVKKWLPILHSGAFHSKDAWKNQNIDDSTINKKDYRITMLLFFDTLEIFGYNGHINFTFYKEGSKIEDIEKEIKAIKNYTIPLLKAKASEVLIPELKIEIQKQASRAAISQVMSRNMSHNIGSHVMNKLTDNKYIENFNVDQLNSYKTDVNLKDKEVCKQIAIFNDYVKTRMDYVSDITYGTPAMLINKMAYNDLFCDLDKVRLLLDNISGRDQNFKYQIKFLDSTGNELNPDNDIILAIPNDVLGCQAFYNIIENYIRNIAKHSPSDNIINEISVKFTDQDINDEFNSYYCVEIFNNCIETDQEIISKINSKINLKIINSRNQLRAESLGLVEMQAGAAYLRQLDISSIDNDKYNVDNSDPYFNSNKKLKILEAFNATKTDGVINLGYRFFIKKPLELLIVCNSIESILTQNPKISIYDLHKKGIQIISKDKFEESIKREVVYNHQFLIVESDLKEIIDRKNAALPLRIFIKTKEEIQMLLKSQDIIKELWTWRKNEIIEKYSSATINLVIDNQPKFPNSSRFMSDIEDHKELPDNDQSYFYLESLSSKGWDQLPKLIVDYNIIQDQTDYLYYLFKDILVQTKVSESFLSRIIVIDERIQNILDKNFNNSLYSQHYKLSNICVPGIDTIDLKDNQIDITKIDNYIESVLKVNNISHITFSNYNDFILIHYSLLERAYNKCSNKNENINKWFEKYMDKVNIVVTSGRGNVRNLPPFVRFVNLSSITTSMIEIKSKYLLHQIVYSSRKTKNIDYE